MDMIDFSELTMVEEAPAEEITAEHAVPVRTRRLRPATELLADFLVAYGDHRGVEPLPAHVFRSYFEEAAPARRRPTPGVFANLFSAAGLPQPPGRKPEVV
jgi:hypothetical protein